MCEIQANPLHGTKSSFPMNNNQEETPGFCRLQAAAQSWPLHCRDTGSIIAFSCPHTCWSQLLLKWRNTFLHHFLFTLNHSLHFLLCPVAVLTVSFSFIMEGSTSQPLRSCSGLVIQRQTYSKNGFNGSLLYQSPYPFGFAYFSQT